MTVISWDGETMAADKLACAGNTKKTTVKIHQLGTKTFGFSGTLSKCHAFLEYVKNDYNMDKFPMLEEDDVLNILVYNSEDDSLLLYENCPYPIPLNVNDRAAIGSGSYYAETAMLLGKNAKESVEVTNDLCVYCGHGVDFIKLRSKQSIDSDFDWVDATS